MNITYGVVMAFIFIVAGIVMTIREIKLFKYHDIKLLATVIEVSELDSANYYNYLLRVEYIFLSKQYNVFIKSSVFKKPKISSEITIRISSKNPNSAGYYGKNDISYYSIISLYVCFTLGLIAYVVYTL